MTDSQEERVLELRFPAYPDRMAMVRSRVRAAATYCGFNATDTQEIVLAVGEACQNIMQHGYAGLETGDIVLGVSRRDDGIVIRVEDFAPPIDLDKIKPPNFSTIKPGGLGMHLIAELMDSSEFLPGAGGTGNILQMTKRVEVSP